MRARKIVFLFFNVFFLYLFGYVYLGVSGCKMFWAAAFFERCSPLLNFSSLLRGNRNMESDRRAWGEVMAVGSGRLEGWKRERWNKFFIKNITAQK